MAQYEYKVVTAPTRGVKAKGIKTPEDRFSHGLEAVMNEHAALGWEYQRAETLPSVERSGLTSSTTTWRNVLVFRRLVDQPVIADVTGPQMTSSDTTNSARIEPVIVAPQRPDADALPADGSPSEPHDEGIETSRDTAQTEDGDAPLNTIKVIEKSDA